MFPVLFEIFGIKVYTYGVLVALGVIIAYLLLIRLARKEGLNVNHVENTVLFALVGGILFARLAYVIEHPENIGSILDIASVWRGGMDFYGGLLGGVLGTIAGIYFYRLPVWKVADMAVVGLSIAHAVGRLGCTSAGCCYGKPVPVDGSITPGLHLMDRFPFFYVSFPPGAVAPPYMPLYPTQLMEFFGLLLIFAVLFFFYRRKPFDGSVFILYMLLYGVLRFSLEFFRGVTPPIEGLGLTWNQVVSLLMVVFAVLLFAVLRKGRAHEVA